VPQKRHADALHKISITLKTCLADSGSEDAGWTETPQDSGRKMFLVKTMIKVSYPVAYFVSLKQGTVLRNFSFSQRCCQRL
jgi:hypothetical protein